MVAADVVSDIQAAALEPGRWPALMGRMGGLFGAGASFLFTSHSPTQPEGMLQTHNLGQDMVDGFRRSWHREDVWALAAARSGRMKAGTVVCGTDLVPRHELLGSRFYNEFSRHHGIDGMLGTVLFDEADGQDMPFTNLCWYREPGRPEFEPQDKQLLVDLLPHLKRSLRLRHQLSSVHRDAAVAEAAHAALGVAILLLDERREILQANGAAQRLLRDGDALLRYSGGQLRGLGARSAPELDEAVRVARPGAALRLLVQADTPHAGLLNATLVALPRDRVTDLGCFEQQRFVLLLELPRSDDAGVVARAGRLFGYTSAEQRVVLRLLDGMSVDDIAQAHGTSVNTVRTQVRGALTKAGVTRQVDLVRMLSRLSG